MAKNTFQKSFIVLIKCFKLIIFLRIQNIFLSIECRGSGEYKKKTRRQHCNVLKLIEKRYMPWYTDLFFGRHNKYIDKQQNQVVLTYTAILRKLNDTSMKEYVSVQSHFYVLTHIYRISLTHSFWHKQLLETKL